MSVENHNICKYCDNAKFDKPCPTCTDLAWEGFSIKEHDKQIRAEAIDEFDRICEEARSHKFGVCDADFVIDVIKAKIKEQLKSQN